MNEPGEKLEKYFGEMLRKQPLRRAPANLERRVMSELRRHALPWWQQNFLHWPMPAKALFIALSAVVVRLCLGLSAWMGGGSSRLLATPVALARPVEWSHKLLDVAAGTRDLGLIVLHAIPSVWVVAGLAIAGICYAVFFGLCAGAYRMLFAQQAI